MRQHVKSVQGSTKNRRRVVWENGKKRLAELIKTAERPLTKQAVRYMFVQARREAKSDYNNKR